MIIVVHKVGLQINNIALSIVRVILGYKIPLKMITNDHLMQPHHFLKIYIKDIPKLIGGWEGEEFGVRG